MLVQSVESTENCRMGINRKTHRLREESLARKRNEEYHRQLYWSGIQSYYNTWGLQASKYNIWASQPQPPISAEREKKLEAENLQKRREKLSKLLNEEKKQLEEELKNFLNSQKKNKNYDESILNGELDTLNMKMMLNGSDQNRVGNLMPKNQIKPNHPILQTLEKKKCQDSMKKCWIEQMKEKREQEAYEKELVRKLEEESARQRQLEEEKEMELTSKRQEDTRLLKNCLLNQMQEMKQKDELTNQLKKQEQHELRLKTELERIAVQRNEAEHQRKKNDLRLLMRNQYQLHMKQRNREIQEQLEEDKRWIDEITSCLEQERTENSKIREEARKEVDRANAKLREYSLLEKQREREMDFMFFEEAKKMWQKQEVQWKAEQEARNNLMRDVFTTIQKQVKEKLQENFEKHKAIANEKEELLRHIEEVNCQLKEKDLEACKKKREYLNDLQQQIRENECIKVNLEQEQRREFLEHQAELEKKEEKILQELQKMNISSLPPVKKTLWR